MTNEVLFLLGFIVFIGVILAMDLGLFHKKNQDVSLKQAGLMSFLMVALAMTFYFIITQYGHLIHGINSLETLQTVINKHHHPIRIIGTDFNENIVRYNYNLGMEFLTGYIVEYALSVDNIFVIMLIFTSFRVDKYNYHPVLFWGILGAILMRFVFIFVGAALITKFGWILYVFGAFLIYTGVKMYLERNKHEEIDIQHHPVVRLANKYFKIHSHFVEDKFFVVVNGIKKMTPLFLVLIIVEFTDLIFAVDSIPAIFSVTHDPYIVFFSNIFAIMGLRSMFFLLASVVDKLRFLKIGLAALLVFIGIKMLAHHYLEEMGFKTSHSLLIIVFILGLSVITSLLFPERKKERKLHPQQDEKKNFPRH
ncbi:MULTISPECIES: TerC/Alx family metal homeostasis membrane protein [Amniculibacterium]|uniref:TerC/Alx family metal homeostasis membrane protein n=1 Tax=Amniculibacterium TaxID=2715289 RepID=UPI000F5A9B18|nr:MULTISPECIES: TerC/Alx family metal homeostasis membrane protein [Amniculibacterium]